MLFRNKLNQNQVAEEALKAAQLTLSPVVHPCLINSSFQHFGNVLAHSAGMKDKCTYSDLLEKLLSLSPHDLFKVKIQANSMAAEIEMQECYPILVREINANLQCYQVEKIYFAKFPKTTSWKSIAPVANYLEVQLTTTWHDPMERLNHCYQNWNSDDAKADIISINSIKISVLSVMKTDVARIQKKVSPKIDCATVNRWLLIEVLKQKESWLPSRNRVIDGYYQDMAEIERSLA